MMQAEKNPNYCVHCGRSNHQLITCIHEAKISRLIIYLIIFLLQILPLVFYKLFLDALPNIDMSYIFWGNLSLVMVVIFMYIYQMMTRKPLLAVFFGCHQQSSRSFKYNVFALSLCARCTGILFGLFLSIILTYAEIQVWIYILMGLPLIIDGALQKYKNIQSTQPRRLITGLMFSPLFVLIYASYNYLIFYLASLF